MDFISVDKEDNADWNNILIKFNLLLNKYLQGTCTYGNIKSRADTKP